MFELDAQKFRDLLVERKMPLRELAKAARVSEVTARRLMNGGQGNPRTVGKLAEALGVDYKKLLKE